jgi:hypothetical protein
MLVVNGSIQDIILEAAGALPLHASISSTNGRTRASFRPAPKRVWSEPTTTATSATIASPRAIGSAPPKKTADAPPPAEQTTVEKAPALVPTTPEQKPTLTAEAAVNRLFQGLGLNTEVCVTEDDILDALRGNRRPLECIAQIVIRILRDKDPGWKSVMLACCDKQVAKHFAVNPVEGQTAEESADEWMKDWLGKLAPSSKERHIMQLRIARVEVTHRSCLRPDTRPVSSAAGTEQHEARPMDAAARRALNRAEHNRRQELKALKKRREINNKVLRRAAK